jgi:hypothetical protein
MITAAPGQFALGNRVFPGLLFDDAFIPPTRLARRRSFSQELVRDWKTPLGVQANCHPVT